MNNFDFLCNHEMLTVGSAQDVIISVELPRATSF